MKILISLCLSLCLFTTVLAEGKSSGGDDFRKTAAEYQDKAKKYGDKGNYDLAASYQRLSEIKLDAANKADQGKWDDIDWSEYEKINEKIAEQKYKHKTKEKKY